jgi:4-hydroxy-tetrahydrodipicolinate synthase
LFFAPLAGPTCYKNFKLSRSDHKMNDSSINEKSSPAMPEKTGQAAPAVPPAEGVIVAALTPMNEDLGCDAALLARHCRTLLEGGASRIALFGTTGEAPSFSVKERKTALEQIIAHGARAGRLMVGTSAAAMPEIVELSRHALDAGCDGVFFMPPFFFRGADATGVIDAMAWCLARIGDTSGRVSLYNFPAMAGATIDLEGLAELLAAYPNAIGGLKDSSGDLEFSKSLAGALGGRRLFVGHEYQARDVVAAGGHGMVSGISNLRLASLIAFLGDGPDQRAAHDRLHADLKALKGLSIIPALKFWLARISGEAAWARMRPPLSPLTDHQARPLLDL